MGAFGELLQKHFGGTKHDVSTWKTPNKLSDEEIADKELLVEIKQDWKHIATTSNRGEANNLLEEVTKEEFKTELGWQNFLCYKNMDGKSGTLSDKKL